MKKLISFGELCAYVLAVLGGFGYSVYNDAYVIALAILILGIMALPELENAWKELIND